MPTFLGALLITAVIAKLPAMKHYENQEYLALKMGELGSGRPEGVDPEFDCAWRGYAYEYAVQVQPWLVSDPTKLSQLYDALQLGPLCKQPPPSLNVSKAKARPATKATKDVVTFFVDAANGKDNQPYSPSAGGITQPFKSVASAVLAVRTVRSTMQGPATIFLRGNAVHYLSETIQLGPGDSQLTIAAYNNEPVVVSGGVHISNLKWTSGPAGSFIADLSDINLPAGVPAMQYGAPSARSRATLARYPNANPELDLFPVGYVTAKTQWRPPLYRGEPCDPKTQCGTSVNVTHVTPDSEWHGMYQNWTTGVGGACDVYDPPRSPWCSGQFYLERQFPEMHTRHPSGIYGDAHLPNIPYSAPSGSIVHAWRPGHWYTWMFEVDDYHVNTTQGSTVWSIQQNQNNVYSKVSVPGQDTSEVKFLGTFTSETECWQACNTSKKGLCTDWTWHHNDFGGAFSGQCYFTVGGDWDPKAQPKVTSARGPYNASGYFEFGAGGNQGGEGNENAGEWYIEGNLEDLDDLNEFWWDDVSRQLHYIPNGTAPPSDIVVPTLINIIEVIGSQAAPVTNVSFVGLTITANRPSFMEPRSNPSGGDWSLERMGAIFLEGTECVSISNSTFERLDSNAVFLSGYNQHASITQNNFRWLGQNAIASWGRPIDNDATNGDFPRYTIVEGNFIFNIGIQQKQSSFYFQAETAQAVIRNNICFNIPRAAINFNDGMGGGADLSSNLLFNTCRESSDHGAFNSWDRLPYITTVRDGTPSTIPAFNNFHHNFVVANFAADGGCLDNDDGSSYYDINHNFCVYGGHKSDFDGNSKISSFNIHAYASVYGAKCLGILAQLAPPKGYAEGYHDNVCILGDAGDAYLDIQGLPGVKCLDGTPASKEVFEDGVQVSNNTVYAPAGNVSIKCGGKTVSLAEFQGMGYDKSSKVMSGLPTAATIIGWAKALLQPE